MTNMYQKSAKRMTAGGHSVHFMQRVIEALDVLPSELAEKLDVDLGDVLALWTGSRGKLVALDQDEVWVKLAEYVDKRIAACLSVREELQRKLNLDRTARAAERQRTLSR